jgi:hypothetical protein
LPVLWRTGGVDLRSSIEGSVTQPPPAKSPEVVMTVWDDGAAGPVRAAPDTSALFDAVRAGDVEPILDHIQSGGEPCHRRPIPLPPTPSPLSISCTFLLRCFHYYVPVIRDGCSQ